MSLKNSNKIIAKDLIPDYRGDNDCDYPPYPAPSKSFLSYCRIYGLKKKYNDICKEYGIDKRYPTINQDIKEYLELLEEKLNYHKSFVSCIKEEIVELKKRISRDT